MGRSNFTCLGRLSHSFVGTLRHFCLGTEWHSCCGTLVHTWHFRLSDVQIFQIRFEAGGMQIFQIWELDVTAEIWDANISNQRFKCNSCSDTSIYQIGMQIFHTSMTRVLSQVWRKYLPAWDPNISNISHNYEWHKCLPAWAHSCTPGEEPVERKDVFNSSEYISSLWLWDEHLEADSCTNMGQDKTALRQEMLWKEGMKEGWVPDDKLVP